MLLDLLGMTYPPFRIESRFASFVPCQSRCTGFRSAVKAFAAPSISISHTRDSLPPESVVRVTGLPLTPATRDGLARGVLDRLPMFERLVPDGVVWAPQDVPPAPAHLAADVILWATGYRPALGHLAPLRLRGQGGGIVMDGPQVVADPRVQLVGYGPSASTVGANRAGRTAVRNLRRLLGF